MSSCRSIGFAAARRSRTLSAIEGAMMVPGGAGGMGAAGGTGARTTAEAFFFLGTAGAAGGAFSSSTAAAANAGCAASAAGHAKQMGRSVSPDVTRPAGRSALMKSPAAMSSAMRSLNSARARLTCGGAAGERWEVEEARRGCIPGPAGVLGAIRTAW